MTTRVVRVVRLPELRLACFERRLASPSAEEFLEATSALWDAFNAWREEVHPALGRIDIAALGWGEAGEVTGEVVLRACVPVRADYRVPAPAKAVIFPGGVFAYCYADNVDEIDEAFATVREWLDGQGMDALSVSLELYKFHYNLDQHPADCGFLVDVEGVRRAEEEHEHGPGGHGHDHPQGHDHGEQGTYAGHAGPLPIARD